MANGFLVDMEFPTLYRANVKNLVRTAIGLNESFDDVYIEISPEASVLGAAARRRRRDRAAASPPTEDRA